MRKGATMTRPPFLSPSRPPNGANIINQLFGASEVAFFAVCLLFEAVWLLRVLCEAVWLLVEVLAIAATGATAIRAPRPIATYFLIITVPLQLSRSTRVARTFAVCASH